MTEKLVDGKTAEKRVAEARKAGVTMGKQWWDGLRADFLPACAPSRQIHIEDEEEIVMQEVTAAMIPWLEDKDFGQLSEVFEADAVFPNQKTFAVVAKVMVKIPCLQPPANHQLHLDFMAFIARHKLHETWPSVAQAMKKIWDAVLGSTASKYKNSDLPVTMWWSGYGHVGQLLIPKTAMEKCCEVKTGPNASWEPVEDELYEVSNSCDTGRDLFVVPLTRLQRTKAFAVINTGIDKLFENDITTATLTEATRAFEARLATMGIAASKVGDPFKVATDRYRAVKLVFTVRSYMEAFRVVLNCAMEGHGVDTEVVPKLGCENGLCPAHGHKTIKIEKACVAGAIRARDTANDLLRGVEQSSGVNIVAMFKKNRGILNGLSKYWRIETCLFDSHVGALGEARFKDQMRDAFPVPGVRRLTLDQSNARFKQLSEGMLLQFCGAGMGEVFNKIYGWVKALVGRRVPDVGADTTPLGIEMRGLLANFQEFTLLIPVEKAGTKVYGAEAVLAIYNSVKEQVQNNDRGLCMKTLEPLQLFGWILSPDQQKEVGKWTLAQKRKGSAPAPAAVAKAAARGGRKRLAPDAAASLAKLYKHD